MAKWKLKNKMDEAEKEKMDQVRIGREEKKIYIKSVYKVVLSIVTVTVVLVNIKFLAVTM